MLSREENEHFTRVGPGTPCGELLRRYWWPIGFTDEVKGPRPQKVRLLGEDFVLFRDGKGQVGLLEPLCAHRRTSLALGRVEEQGLRCCYHGWLFDAAGRCLDQPCEDEGATFKDKVRQKSYPVQEAAGLIFAYIGPLPAPLLPKYDMLEWQGGKRVLWSNLNYCNWLQSVENACDVSHIPWLHAGPYPGFAAQKPRITWDRTASGMHFEIRLANYNDANTGEVIFPSANRFASSRVGTDVSQLKDRDQDARQNFAVPRPRRRRYLAQCVSRDLSRPRERPHHPGRAEARRGRIREGRGRLVGHRLGRPGPRRDRRPRPDHRPLDGASRALGPRRYHVSRHAARGDQGGCRGAGPDRRHPRPA